MCINNRISYTEFFHYFLLTFIMIGSKVIMFSINLVTVSMRSMLPVELKKRIRMVMMLAVDLQKI